MVVMQKTVIEIWRSVGMENKLEHEVGKGQNKFLKNICKNDICKLHLDQGYQDPCMQHLWTPRSVDKE